MKSKTTNEEAVSEKPTGIEQKLFSWKNWEHLGQHDLGFSDCILKVDIGPHRAGDCISEICMVYSVSRIELRHTDTSNVEAYEMNISFGKHLDKQAEAVTTGKHIVLSFPSSFQMENLRKSLLVTLEESKQFGFITEIPRIEIEDGRYETGMLASKLLKIYTPAGDRPYYLGLFSGFDFLRKNIYLYREKEQVDISSEKK